MKFVEGQWQPVGNLGTTGYIAHLHLCVTKGDIPVVAYIGNFRRVRVRKFVENTWVDFGALGTRPFGGKLNPNQYARAYQFRDLWFDISQSGVPYVLFYRTSRIQTRGVKGDVGHEEIFVYRFTGLSL